MDETQSVLQKKFPFKKLKPGQQSSSHLTVPLQKNNQSKSAQEIKINQGSNNNHGFSNSKNNNGSNKDFNNNFNGNPNGNYHYSQVNNNAKNQNTQDSNPNVNAPNKSQTPAQKREYARNQVEDYVVRNTVFIAQSGKMADKCLETRVKDFVAIQNLSTIS